MKEEKRDLKDLVDLLQGLPHGFHEFFQEQIAPTFSELHPSTRDLSVPMIGVRQTLASLKAHWSV